MGRLAYISTVNDEYKISDEQADFDKLIKDACKGKDICYTFVTTDSKYDNTIHIRGQHIVAVHVKEDWTND